MLPGTSADDRCIMCEIWLGVTYITLKMREFSHTLGKTVMYWNEEVDKNKGENVPDRTRTCGLTLRRRALYPLSYGDYIMDDTICVNVSQAKNNDAPHNYCFSHRLSKRATARVALQNHSRAGIISLQGGFQRQSILRCSAKHQRPYRFPAASAAGSADYYTATYVSPCVFVLSCNKVFKHLHTLPPVTHSPYTHPLATYFYLIAITSIIL